jgi:SAM-dependent methyltransferase
MANYLAEYYDAVINWERRLERELPLLENLARGAGGRVLVAACGTGGHVAALARRGFRVLGLDVDPDMVAFAQERLEREANAIAAAGGEAKISLLTMQESGKLGPVYDAVFCLGNALPGIAGAGELGAALKGVVGALRAGGLWFTQNLNYDRRWKEKAAWFPLLTGETAKEEVLLVKFAAYDDQGIDFHVMYLVREKTGGKWQSRVRSSRQAPLFASVLAEELGQAGFGKLQYWGDYGQAPFDPEKSNDLLVVGTKV